MDVFTIKDIENLTGIKAHTIRVWEQRYSFLQPRRTTTNIRFYSGNQLQKILGIALLNKYGYKISHIDRMSTAEIDRRISELPHEQAQQERLVNDLLTAMTSLQLEAFGEILDSDIRKKGIEHTILQLIFPFLDRLGLLWLTNHVQPAHEHLVSNIIRQKLILGIEKLGVRSSAQSAVLLLPEGEHHELALLFIQYLLKRRGIKTWYLGADTPFTEFLYIAKKVKPDFVFTHITAPAGNFKLARYIADIHTGLPGVQAILSGAFVHGYHRKTPGSIHLMRTLESITAFIDTLP
ncbi:MerR family transcriptional regulator [Sediminibacterium soli]|uniref:MerR family transcriptional regulator n=1 Tax=Sediminibacterium soli TaxID=2698829 RepID=UPI0013798C5A|nr:MerR family transcriptional regulator [Sediminibacterium soli]NCI45393.1 cobalamin B12-binding domain-containing protein [Sediminibacterium soli]